MAEKLIIPMTVLAHRIKNFIQVPAINPNYKTALKSYLGKDSSPAAFNKNILLKKGVHLHFILPSALKKGIEVKDNDGNTSFEYPAVPDRYIITRTYISNGKIEADCNIVESNFYSLDNTYNESVTIPKFDDLRQRHRFRYLGRTYSAMKAAPEPLGEYGYFDKITAVGAGDPMFNAYYPSCQGVFGFYDSLENVPQDAVLTYLVLGYYSNSGSDIFSNVKTAEDMKRVLAQYGLSADNNVICNSCVLFGEVGGIKLSFEMPPPTGEINIGIGKSSAEALSSVIANKYYPKANIERFITSIQYDTADEVSQPDGNFKIDDDIHLRGFSQLDPIETAFTVKLPDNAEKSMLKGLAEPYSEIVLEERKIGKMRRLLEYKKNSLYYLWEIYMDASREKKIILIKHMDLIIEEISKLRSDINNQIIDTNKKITLFRSVLNTVKAELEQISPEPFYYPKDPALMLFGSGMNRTYAFGEDGRFESDNTLYCLTKTLTSDISKDKILSYFNDMSYFGVCDNYKDYAVMAVLLDNVNLLPRLNLIPKIDGKYSPVMFNDNPIEQVTLMMQWETAFYSDYSDSNPKNSFFEYANTDYIYNGVMAEKLQNCSGISVLTPHGVYNLQDKLEKYLENHSESPDASAIANKIKHIAAVSQNLGGFNLSLTALKYFFQFPVDIDPEDNYSKRVSECLMPDNNKFYEPPVERLAVQNNTGIFPLREGFFALTKLTLVSTFGEQRMLIDDNLSFKGTKYFSENLYPVKDGYCFFPLNLTSAARLSAYFVTVENNRMPACSLPGATPVIGIFLPDMLNRNLNVFDNSGLLIGIIKTAYRHIGTKKKAVGRFIKSPNAPVAIDSRISALISALTQDNSAFYEVMSVIDQKLNITIPPAQNDFIFGRALILAEMAVNLEYFGGAEWSKKDADAGKFDDRGLSKQSFPVMFGDKERVTDGVCCGFYNGFEKGFAAFGAESEGNKYLNAEPFSISSAENIKNVTLLFDPSLKVTISTGILPVQQMEIPTLHSDFSEVPLFSAELNTLISEEQQIQLPDFSENFEFSRLYPVLLGGSTAYKKLDIVNSSPAIGSVGETIITDGIIVGGMARNNNSISDDTDIM